MKETGSFALFRVHRPLGIAYQPENLYTWLQRGPNQCRWLDTSLFPHWSVDRGAANRQTQTPSARAFVKHP